MRLPFDVVERMVEIRRDLHQHPELSWQETRTAAAIAARLRALGYSPRTGVGGKGVVVDVAGSGDGPRVALRADMDALPIQEDTGLSFASIHDGVMHACGHDGHSAMLLGAAEVLASAPPPIPVRLLWQPAEEHGNGAKAMIEDGVLEGVDLIFGGHVDRHYPPGVLVVSEGAVNASTDTFHLRITGQQGHGARPHEAVDAIVVASLLVTALQTIVSREVDPAHPSVVTVGSLHAGSAPNVIAGEAVLEGTIRAQDASVRAHLHRSLTRIAKAIGDLHTARVAVEIREGTPPLINPPGPTAIAAAAAARVVGAGAVTQLHTANMGGEDFAWYLERVGGCYIRFGAQVEGRAGYPAHSSRFDFHEDALQHGAAWYLALIDEVARRA
jgi:amidohydrolase